MIIPNRPFAHEFVEFGHPSLGLWGGKKSGVYMIDDVYIGASTRVRQRVLWHINSALANNHDNKALGLHIKSKVKAGQRIKVKLLSEQITDEYALINQHRELGFKLLNSTSVYAKTYQPKP